MRILVVSQYFWPESFRINDLCIGLQERGHTITVLTGKPNYPLGRFSKGYGFGKAGDEIWNNIKIFRTNLIPRGKGTGFRLIINYLSFAFFAVFKLIFIKGDFDLIFVYEPSPITVGIPAIFAKYKFKAPIYFWVQDLWPESITAAGGIQNRQVLNSVERLTKYIYRKSDYVLIQSLAFKDYIINQGIPSDKIIYYPNSTEIYYNVKKKNQKYLSKLFTGFNLIFAGNIGEAQSFDTLLAAANILKNEQLEVKWNILGDGRMKEYVQSKIDELKLSDCVNLLGAFPSEEMPDFFACADALVVSLKKDKIFGLTIPTKVQSYMACGKPIIASLDGEGARIIEEANAGFCAPTENPVELANCIKKLVFLSPDERENLGKNARSYFEREFEREKLLDKLDDIFTHYS